MEYEAFAAMEDALLQQTRLNGLVPSRRLRGVKINPIYQENDASTVDGDPERTQPIGEVQIEVYDSLPCVVTDVSENEEGDNDGRRLRLCASTSALKTLNADTHERLGRSVSSLMLEKSKTKTQRDGHKNSLRLKKEHRGKEHEINNMRTKLTNGVDIPPDIEGGELRGKECVPTSSAVSNAMDVETVPWTFLQERSPSRRTPVWKAFWGPGVEKTKEKCLADRSSVEDHAQFQDKENAHADIASVENCARTSQTSNDFIHTSSCPQDHNIYIIDDDDDDVIVTSETSVEAVLLTDCSSSPDQQQAGLVYSKGNHDGQKNHGEHGSGASVVRLKRTSSSKEKVSRVKSVCASTSLDSHNNQHLFNSSFSEGDNKTPDTNSVSENSRSREQGESSLSLAVEISDVPSLNNDSVLCQCSCHLQDTSDVSAGPSYPHPDRGSLNNIPINVCGNDHSDSASHSSSLRLCVEDTALDLSHTDFIVNRSNSSTPRAYAEYTAVSVTNEDSVVAVDTSTSQQGIHAVGDTSREVISRDSIPANDSREEFTTEQCCFHAHDQPKQADSAHSDKGEDDLESTSISMLEEVLHESETLETTKPQVKEKAAPHICSAQTGIVSRENSYHSCSENLGHHSQSRNSNENASYDDSGQNTTPTHEAKLLPGDSPNNSTTLCLEDTSGSVEDIAIERHRVICKLCGCIRTCVDPFSTDVVLKMSSEIENERCEMTSQATRAMKNVDAVLPSDSVLATAEDLKSSPCLQRYLADTHQHYLKLRAGQIIEDNIITIDTPDAPEPSPIPPSSSSCHLNDTEDVPVIPMELLDLSSSPELREDILLNLAAIPYVGEPTSQQPKTPTSTAGRTFLPKVNAATRPISSRSGSRHSSRTNSRRSSRNSRMAKHSSIEDVEAEEEEDGEEEDGRAGSQWGGSSCSNRSNSVVDRNGNLKKEVGMGVYSVSAASAEMIVPYDEAWEEESNYSSRRRRQREQQAEQQTWKDEDESSIKERLIKATVCVVIFAVVIGIFIGVAIHFGKARHLDSLNSGGGSGGTSSSGSGYGVSG